MKKVKNLQAITHIPELEESFVSKIQEFDQRGYETLDITYSASEQIESKTVTKFDNKGNKTDLINYFEDEQLSDHTQTKYNDNNEIVEEKILYADGSWSVRKHERSRNLITITQTDDENELEEKETRQVDGKGNIIEQIVFNEDEQIVERFVNTFDENQKLLNRKEYTEGGDELILERKYKYDDHGNMIQRMSVSSKGKIIDLVKNTYDNQNRLLKQEMKNQFVAKYIYDDEKHEVTEERYHANGVLVYNSVSRFDADGFLQEEEYVDKKVVYKYEFY